LLSYYFSAIFVPNSGASMQFPIMYCAHTPQ